MIRRILTAVALAFVATVLLAPAAVADNCDIFINPEDCQNTGWTIGTIATVTGGVAVATVAVVTAQSNHTSTPPTPPPPLPGSQPPRPARMVRPRRERDDDTAIDGVEARPAIDAPVVTVRPQDDPGRAHSIRLEVGRDAGTQTVQEIPNGPH